MIIRLHFLSGIAAYLNIDHIAYFAVRGEDPRNSVEVFLTNGNSIIVTESPRQILELIEEISK